MATIENNTPKRYAQDIRRIVGTDNVDKSLGPAEERDAIKSKRTVGYLESNNSFSSSSSSSSTTPSSDISGTGINETSPSVSVGDKYDGAYANQWNPYDQSTYYNNLAAGTYDVGDIIDNKDGPAIADPQHPENNKILLSLDGLRDCDDTMDLKLLWTDSFPIPEGWTDAEIPPAGTDTSWQSGYYWLSTWGLATNQTTVAAAAQEIADGLGGSVQSIDDVGFGPSQYTATILKPNLTTQGFAVNRYACPSIPDICVATAPNWPTGYTTSDGDFPYTVSTNWPSDSTQLIKYSNHSFSVSKYEGDLGNGWEPNTSYGKVYYSFAGGTRYGVLEPASDGGMLVYESATCGDATPIGPIKHYAPNRTLQGVYSYDLISQLRPPAENL